MRSRAWAGRRGPDLSGVGTRLTRDQLIDQISNGTPGGGNMPAYGKQIRPAEMTALVDFLVSLRPPGHERGPTGRRGPTVTMIEMLRWTPRSTPSCDPGRSSLGCSSRCS